ncbi:hypothetical protein EVAR_32481_1 [Eumeta japonica]|uniref:Uncharacterized protein n=1 Tax=Eumeta variegata TaxID=151549 RepID=A0A4C1VMF8_EUMVA|nr:hypothetical protein EVAR_32481_1 [Eumeta japonica]
MKDDLCAPTPRPNYGQYSVEYDKMLPRTGNEWAFEGLKFRVKMRHPPHSVDLATYDLFSKINGTLKDIRFMTPEVAVNAFEKRPSDISKENWAECSYDGSKEYKNKKKINNRSLRFSCSTKLRHSPSAHDVKDVEGICVRLVSVRRRGRPETIGGRPRAKLLWMACLGLTPLHLSMSLGALASRATECPMRRIAPGGRHYLKYGEWLTDVEVAVAAHEKDVDVTLKHERSNRTGRHQNMSNAMYSVAPASYQSPWRCTRADVPALVSTAALLLLNFNTVCEAVGISYFRMPPPRPYAHI